MAYLLIFNQRNNTKHYNYFRFILNNNNISDFQVQSCYRFNKVQIEQIIQIVGGHLHRYQNGLKAQTVELQVLCALRYFATGTHFGVLANVFKINKSTVSKNVHSVANAICLHANEYIQFPTEINSIRQTMAEFSTIANMPNVIGAVDGTMVSIFKLFLLCFCKIYTFNFSVRVNNANFMFHYKTEHKLSIHTAIWINTHSLNSIVNNLMSKIKIKINKINKIINN